MSERLPSMHVAGKNKNLALIMDIVKPEIITEKLAIEFELFDLIENPLTIEIEALGSCNELETINIDWPDPQPLFDDIDVFSWLSEDDFNFFCSFNCELDSFQN